MPVTHDFNAVSSTGDTPSDTINKLIDDALQQDHALKLGRDYLGASRLGEPCARALQYDYTQTSRDKPFTGQTLRIFEMGHMLEKRTWQWLQGAGFVIDTHDPATGEVYGFSAAQGQLQGHVDGIMWQVPESLEPAIKVPAIWECKSLNAKSWKHLVDKGVKVSKPVYAVQIALYQAYMEELIPGVSQNPALLTAVNKDTSEIYHEFVPFDAALAQTASDRAVHILRATQAGETLPRISQDPDSFYCRFCDWQNTCWKEIV
ncbi:hypothetical protein EQU50_03445 [Candidatus Finniella inopinata]|uniref:PD-(D/E)XK endonuclease-like domain-containing protein n=2 Tax=Candidatus Finniella inopinata TaxID=1696036 RepID=A0A4Q7DP18_9PROT|nr:hypothetical protein EQU50_03445 [Candidatus Finniella inopinata]